MAITMGDRKDRYYKLVVKKGSAIYSLWGNSGTISKQIVAKANEYAFDKRLKSDYSYRFQVLAFTYALELRLEKRYKGFFRKLFRLFAYLRETEACRLLKRVMGFSSATPMLEMISVEMERLAMRLSERDDDQTAGGGKRVGASDMTLEEELQSILGENVQEEQKTEEKDVNSAEKDGAEVQATDEQQKSEDGREKISVKELDGGQKTDAQEKEASTEKEQEAPENTQVEEPKTETSVEGKAETATEKSVASTSILAEIMVAQQEKGGETPSPFPIFREEKGAGEPSANQTADAESKEEADMNSVKEGEGVDKDNFVQSEKDPFPVFSGEQKAPEATVEKTTEQEAKTESSTEKETARAEKPVEKEVIREIVKEPIKEPVKEPIKLQENAPRETMEVSDENKARREVSGSLSNEELKAYISQLKESASIVMQEEETAWREKISVEQQQDVTETSVRVDQNSQKTITLSQKP